MKKLFSSIVALSFAVAGFTAVAETAYPDASPEASPEPVAVATPDPAPAAAPACKVEVPQTIADHLALRFPGETVYGITREGVTYVVDLGDGLHIRYDNCFNPICYGVHDHEADLNK
ncbi:MAG: PepSY-like domain-containing protein [Muribaculaceae bacterium]|nr:PepSY-like domain-containing protein [Muribaculaceae bacterium]